MESSDVAVSQTVTAGGTMAAAADAVVEELMAMGGDQVTAEPTEGTALKSDPNAKPGLGAACGR